MLSIIALLANYLLTFSLAIVLLIFIRLAVGYIFELWFQWQLNFPYLWGFHLLVFLVLLSFPLSGRKFPQAWPWTSLEEEVAWWNTPPFFSSYSALYRQRKKDLDLWGKETFKNYVFLLSTGPVLGSIFPL